MDNPISQDHAEQHRRSFISVVACESCDCACQCGSHPHHYPCANCGSDQAHHPVIGVLCETCERLEDERRRSRFQTVAEYEAARRSERERRIDDARRGPTIIPTA